jgi:hypothetical protein
VPIVWPEGKVGRGHLLPDVRPHERNSFVRVPGGRSVAHGMVAFVGTSVTAADRLARWESTIGRVEEREAALDQLEGYVRWLDEQRLGSIFEAEYDRGGVLVAKKVSDHLPRRRSPIPE